MFRKVTLLEISKRPLLMVLTGLQYIVCNAARNKYLTKFLKGVLKLPKKVVSNMVPYQKYTDIQTAAFYLACF